MNVEIEFLEWVHPNFGVMPAKVEGGKPLVLKAKINTPKREWNGLTDEEVIASSTSSTYMDELDAWVFARDIEAKLKKKNTK